MKIFFKNEGKVADILSIFIPKRISIHIYICINTHTHTAIHTYARNAYMYSHKVKCNSLLQCSKLLTINFTSKTFAEVSLTAKVILQFSLVTEVSCLFLILRLCSYPFMHFCYCYLLLLFLPFSCLFPFILLCSLIIYPSASPPTVVRAF